MSPGGRWIPADEDPAGEGFLDLGEDDCEGDALADYEYLQGEHE